MKFHAALFLGIFAVLCGAAVADWDVRAAGALGDGETDDTGAFQAALDAAAEAGGGVVQVPAGHYCIRGTLQIPGAVTLQGIYRTPPLNFSGKDGGLAGSVLQAYAGRGETEGEPFIRLAGHTATLAGLIITYPEWKQTDVPPVPYPPAVMAGRVEDCAVLDCLIINAYEALHFQNSARMIIRNVFGYPSRRGLYIDSCLDISRVENCHFWPFGVAYKHDDPYCKWVNTNGVAFEFARTDWQYVTHTFCFGYGIGYRFSKTGNGSCNGSFVGIGADSCRRAVYVEDAQPPGLLITNGEFVGRWGSDDSVGIEIGPECGTGKINLSNCAFWGPLDMCLWSRSPQAQLTVSTTNFCNWDINGRGAPAVKLDAGKAVLQGNTFDDGNLHVEVGEKMASAILMANQAGGGFRCDNRAGKRTQLVANEENAIEWTEEAERNYMIDVGSSGDGLYAIGFHGREKAAEWGEEGTKRWSGLESRLSLPTIPGKRYEVTLDIRMPHPALDAANGLYLGEECLAALPDAEGQAMVTAHFQAAEPKTVLLLRVKTWRPVDVNQGSGDARSLGVAVRSIRVHEETAEKSPVFCANTGEWKPE